MVRLAYGVVAGRDLRVWAPGPDGMPIEAARSQLAPGSPVVVAERSLDRDAVAAAVEELRALVAAGGVVAAGASVELRPGARSARLAGAGGDRRDAVLAALRALGPDGSTRLGERAGILVTLFGSTATKPVGAAATAALHDGRWAALHLASAASDLLGPEQLERVLRLTCPDDMNREAPGLASVLAAHLDQVFGPVAKPRRLALLTDIWNTVIARSTMTQRRRRLLGGLDRRAEVRQRYRQAIEEFVVAQISYEHRDPQTLDIARWTPQLWHWQQWLRRAMHDAMAATVLSRMALAVINHGIEAGLASVESLLATAPILLTKRARTEARRRLAGFAGLPARPGVYVHDISDVYKQATTAANARMATIVERRLGHTLDYGLVVLEATRELIQALERSGLDELTDQWTCPHLRQWREVVGYSAGRAPHDWEQPVLGHTSPPLAQRLREAPDRSPIELEQAGDLLWYADLADAIAQLEGHPAAVVTYGIHAPVIDLDAPRVDVDPLRPPDESLALAVAGAAQLVQLGAEVAVRARSWDEFVNALMASTVVAQALTGSFPVPAPMLARDGVVVPGTDTRLEIARDPHQLAEWARFMGNCIASPHYLMEASKGRSVLAALRSDDGRILANLELCHNRSGWRIEEFRVRFNGEPEPELAERVQAWVATVPATRMARPVVVPRLHGHGSVSRTRRRSRTFGEVRQALAPLAIQALNATDVGTAIDVLSLAGTGSVAGLAGVTALRRTRQSDLDTALRHGLATDSPDLLTLWRATAVRPLATAVADLDPSFRDSLGYVAALLADGPLPAAARRLGRVPEVAQARSVELVARRIRRVIGELARAADPMLAPLVPRHCDTNLLCALVLAVSTAATAEESRLRRITNRGDVAVPGYPPSTLDDEAGPWRRASADAEDLGAQLPWRLPAPALLIPREWLGRGGWPALWARASRASRESRAPRAALRV